jgi:hypothetical protein
MTGQYPSAKFSPFSPFIYSFQVSPPSRGDDDGYPFAAIKLCPELVPPEIRAVREPKIEDLLRQVVGEGCGLRPGRTSGIRLESEWWDHKGKRTQGENEDNDEGKVLVVYNYG